jgi:hypothetical protein
MNIIFLQLNKMRHTYCTSAEFYCCKNTVFLGYIHVYIWIFVFFAYMYVLVFAVEFLQNNLIF